MRTFISLIAVIIAMGGCATDSKEHIVQDDGMSSFVNINGSIYINEVIDETVGQALDPQVKQEVVETLNDKIIKSGRYELAQSDRDANYVLTIRVIQFTAGNRAARFWVGFGAGSAKLTFICELYDSEGEMVDQRKFQRFGAASLRSGGTIIQQMKGILIEYSGQWIKV